MASDRKDKPVGGGEYDATGFDVTPQGKAPTASRVLAEGTKEEVRGLLLAMGSILMHGRELAPDLSRWLGEALVAIADGKDPKTALRLNNKKKYGVHHLIALEHMVTSAQGVSKEEALSFAARFDPVTGTLKDDPDGKAAERLRKLLGRRTK